MRTFVAKPEQVQAERKWWVVDAKNQPLGRVATRVAALLRGKHKPVFTPHVDTGDFVIVVNAAEVGVTGAKSNDKKYYSHSGYPGHLKTKSFGRLIVEKPEAPITLAVKGMLPKNVLGRQILKKLKVYPSAQHPHEAQKPESFSF